MKTKKLTLICSIGLILVLLVTLVLAACAKEEAPAPAAPTAPAKVFNWKVQNNVDVTHCEYTTAVDWSKLIEQYTGGRMTFTHYPAGGLVKAPEMLDALRDNTIQMVSSGYGGYWKAFMPEGGLECGLPMLIRSASEMYTLFFDLGWNDILMEAYAEHGAYYAGPHGYGFVPIWSSKPLRTLSDFEGLKIRAVGEMAVMLDNMGAATVYLPHDESYMALQLGTIDAYSTSLALFKSMKHYETCKYVMWPPVLAVGITNALYGLAALDELPEDLSNFMKSHDRLHCFMQTYHFEEADASVLREVGDLGVEVVQMDQEVIDTMAQAGVSFLDDYAAKGARTAKMVDIMKVFLRERGYID